MPCAPQGVKGLDDDVVMMMMMYSDKLYKSDIVWSKKKLISLLQLLYQLYTYVHGRHIKDVASFTL